MKTRNIEPKWLLVFVFFMSGVFLGSLSLYLWINVSPNAFYKLNNVGGNFKYINPFLTAEAPSGQFGPNHSIDLRVRGLITKNKANGNINWASFYFRDLQSGQWVGINEDAPISPGKLLKIPIMIAYYKLAENNPSILDTPITVESLNPNRDSLSSPETLRVGETYSVNQLIEKMIVQYSDNAALMLYDNIDKPALNEVFSDIGIPFKEDRVTQDIISLKLYSLFFRVLYNSTYLDTQYSEKALALLDKANSNIGLSAALPKDISAPTRYGAHNLPGGGVEMYDCSVVYYPSHPYIACATAQGPTLTSLETFLHDVGAATYAEVKLQYP